MKLGVGLRSPLPGAVPDPAEVRDWAQMADDAGFASVGTTDRVVHANYETLSMLAYVGGLTTRVELLTNVLITPVRETTLLAKQLVTVDNLSGGRLTVGVGIGGRANDYAATGHQTKGRGVRLESQIASLRDVWNGLDTAGGPVGPPPSRAGGPPILVGGGSRSVERSARLADGWIAAWPARIDDDGPACLSGIGDEPVPLAGEVDQLRDGWTAHGRVGRPLVYGMMYVSLGDAARDRSFDYLHAWYQFSPYLLDNAMNGLSTSVAEIAAGAAAFDKAGCDMLSLTFCGGDPDDAARLAVAIPEFF